MAFSMYFTYIFQNQHDLYRPAMDNEFLRLELCCSPMQLLKQWQNKLNV